MVEFVVGVVFYSLSLVVVSVVVGVIVFVVGGVVGVVGVEVVMGRIEVIMVGYGVGGYVVLSVRVVVLKFVLVLLFFFLDKIILLIYGNVVGLFVGVVVVVRIVGVVV